MEIYSPITYISNNPDGTIPYGNEVTERNSIQKMYVPFKRELIDIVTDGSVFSAFVTDAEPDNVDNSGASLIANMNASATLGPFATVFHWINGTSYGLRINTRHPNNENFRNMSCRIDGVAYPIVVKGLVNPYTLTASNTLTTNTIENQYQSVIIATDLTAGPHYVELSWIGTADNIGGTDRLWGYIIDESDNINDQEKTAFGLYPQIGLTTAIKNLLPNSGLPPSTTLLASNINIYCIEQILLTNITASPIKVTIKNSRAKSLVGRYSVGADSTIQVTLPKHLWDSRNIQAFADSGVSTLIVSSPTPTTTSFSVTSGTGASFPVGTVVSIDGDIRTIVTQSTDALTVAALSQTPLTGNTVSSGVIVSVIGKKS